MKPRPSSSEQRAPRDHTSRSCDAGSVPGTVAGEPNDQLDLSFIQCVGSWEIQPNQKADPHILAFISGVTVHPGFPGTVPA